MYVYLNTYKVPDVKNIIVYQKINTWLIACKNIQKLETIVKSPINQRVFWF